MDRMKKGMLFMLSTVLLSSAFLYLLSSASFYSNSLRETAARLSELERLNAHSDDVVFQLRSILLNGAVDVNVYGLEGMKVVTLEESVPFAAHYYADIFYFKEFAESNTLFTTSINISDAARPRMFINPYNITIDHPIGRIMFIPENSPGSAGSVSSYNVLIKTDGPTPWINWTNITEVSAYDPDAVHLHMGLQGVNGTVSADKYLDRYAYSELVLHDSQTNDTMFVIQLDSPAALTVNHDTEATVKTEIYLNDNGEDTTVELGEDIVSVSSEYVGEASKVSGVTLYEG
jgi:hypothetical protein